jgi:hypothetical protein
MSFAFKIAKTIDRNTPKISYLEIPKSKKSLNLCSKIVLWGAKKKIVCFYNEMQN